MDKKTARKTGRESRSFLHEEEARKKSSVIAEKLKTIVQDCGTVCCYVSLPDEVRTDELIAWMLEKGIRVTVPKTVGGTLEFHEIFSLEELVPGAFGVREPAAERPVGIGECDMVIVPVCAFDEHCARVGYGRGYYDSVLAGAKHAVGIAYEVQKTDIIETDPWDVPLDEIVTEARKYVRSQTI
ncbi:MAG: 5-formyltetrahydrofolate cyclo-ligase [Solobacterium sp.]|nr:5-formyltetrahydrofolate cyclo-ligase [Solobacterium sp.]